MHTHCLSFPSTSSLARTVAHSPYLAHAQRLHARAFRVQTLADFTGVFYSGVYCGVTVFSTAFAIERQMLFYTIAVPMVDALSTFGIPTFLRYDDTSNK